MNSKTAHLISAVLAVAALCTFAGAASAADSCTDIKNHVTANPGKVEAALFAHFGGDDHLVAAGEPFGAARRTRWQRDL